MTFDDPSRADSPSRRTRRRDDDDDRRRRRRRRILAWTLSVAGALVVLVAAAAVVGTIFYQQAMSAKDDLTAAKTKILAIPALVKANDSAQLAQSAADVQKLVGRALETTGNPLWELAAKVPFVGANIVAVQQTTKAADILVEGALPPGLQLMSSLQSHNLKLTGGGVNLKPFQDAQKSLPKVIDAFQRASNTVSGIDRAKLLPAVDDSISGILDVVRETTPTLKTAQRLLPILLPMAGADGPRNYLLVFQNNAEIRATGGIPSKLMVLQIDHGHIAPADEALSSAVARAGNLGIPYVEWPPQVRSIYLNDTTAYLANYTRTPNFPRTAQLLTTIWKNATTQRLDGIISIDPVVLSHMLAAAGSVKVAGQTLTAGDVVQNLLSDTYERLPRNADSNIYFALVAKAVFDKLSAGGWDPAKMLEQLTTSVKEQRIYAWFPKATEQALAVEVGIDGQLPTTNEKSTVVGAFLNDQTVGKLEYWLRSSVVVTCEPSTRKVTTTVTLQNTIPDRIRSDYTLGWRDRKYGYQRTTMLIDVLFFPPAGATGNGLSPTHGDIRSLDRSGVEDGRNVTSITLAVKQGQTRKASQTVTLPKGALGPLEVRYSPTTSPTPVHIDATCAALTGAH